MEAWIKQFMPLFVSAVHNFCMIRYQNLSGDSGIRSFEIDNNHIIIQFLNGATYRYGYKNPGRGHVEQMKKLARAGRGLATYINKHVRENYEDKF